MKNPPRHLRIKQDGVRPVTKLKEMLKFVQNRTVECTAYFLTSHIRRDELELILFKILTVVKDRCCMLVLFSLRKQNFECDLCGETFITMKEFADCWKGGKGQI